jgi:uncharacterized membrane protein YfcA
MEQTTKPDKKHKRLAVLLFIMITLVMCMIIVGVLGDAKDWVYANHINDKITHIIFAATLTFLASYILHPLKLRISFLEINLGTIIMFSLFTFDEVSQVILPGRDADPFDLLASWTGLALGYLFYKLWSNRKTKKVAPKAKIEEAPSLSQGKG